MSRFYSGILPHGNRLQQRVLDGYFHQRNLTKANAITDLSHNDVKRGIKCHTKFDWFRKTNEPIKRRVISAFPRLTSL